MDVLNIELVEYCQVTGGFLRKAFNHYIRTTATIGKDTNGKAIRKEFYGKSKKEAEEKKEEYLNGLNNGLVINYQELNLKDLMRLWLFEVLLPSEKIKPSTFDRYEGIFRNYIENSELAYQKVYHIKSLQIQRFYNSLYENNKSSATIRNPCFKLIIPGNASTNIKQEIEPFSETEIDKIKTCINGTTETIFLLALGTGLRAGELLALTHADINTKAGIVSITKKNIYHLDCHFQRIHCSSLQNHAILLMPEIF